MKILWLTWKDHEHPQAGGAEVVNMELARRLVADGHEVILLVGGFPGATAELRIAVAPAGPTAKDRDYSLRVIRLGNRYTVYIKAFWYYRKHLQGWADLVIDEVNTMPFMAKFYVKEPNILLVYMLCQKIWFYQITFLLSLVGYVIEPLYLRLLNDRRVITISDSSKNDLLGFGFDRQNISIISVGIEARPVSQLAPGMGGKHGVTLLSLGSIRPMKQTLDQIAAFEIAKAKIPDLRLVIAGDNGGRYGQRVMRKISRSPFAQDIDYIGRVSRADKLELMRQCRTILVTSIKEGWGLVVTEAASQGTPAIVYDVDGLRDSVRHNKTGVITQQNTPASLAASIVALLGDEVLYTKLRRNAWEWSKEITFDQSYKQFLTAITK